MTVERRFAAGMRETDRDSPGLVQEDDGTVWYVKPDGSRAEIGTGGSNPFVGDVVKVTGTTSQSIPDSEWTQFDLSAHAVVTNTQPWAEVVTTDLVIDPTAGILVVTQGWVTWAASAVGAVRGLLIAHSGGGTPQFLDDMPIMLTPDQYAALSDFEGSMGGEVTNRVDPVDGLSLQFWVYQDSGGALNCDFGVSFVTPIA